MDWKYTFLSTLENTYKNFFLDYGIQCDYIVRDLVDMFMLIKTYSHLITIDFVQELKDTIHYAHLKEVMWLFDHFFIPDVLS